MSRLAVQAQTSKRALVFKPIEATSKHEPMLYLPGDIVSPGNSIGGYVTIPDKTGDCWGFWRIGGGTINRLNDPELRSDLVSINGISRYAREISRITSADPEAVARNRGRYLLALSSGSARRGLLHNLDRASNPLLDLLRELRVPTNHIERVESSDGEYTESYDYLFPRYHFYNQIFTDGEVSEISFRNGSEVDSGYDPRYPSGNEYSRRTISVSGSTFVIRAGFAQSQFNIGPNGVPLRTVQVKLTPQADLQKVVEVLSSTTCKS